MYTEPARPNNDQSRSSMQDQVKGGQFHSQTVRIILHYIIYLCVTEKQRAAVLGGTFRYLHVIVQPSCFQKKAPSYALQRDACWYIKW